MVYRSYPSNLFRVFNTSFDFRNFFFSVISGFIQKHIMQVSLMKHIPNSIKADFIRVVMNKGLCSGPDGLRAHFHTSNAGKDLSNFICVWVFFF